MTTSSTKTKKVPHNFIPCLIKCPVCILKYSDVQELDLHIETHISKIWHECDKCSNVYNTEFELQLHTVCFHKIGSIFVCTECGQNFKDTLRLKQHLFTHRNVDASFLELLDRYHYTIPGLSKLKNECAFVADTSIKCVVCNFVLSSKLTLKDHFDDNHRKNTCIHACKICHMTFILKSTLIIHEKLYHNNKAYLILKKKPNSEDIRINSCNNSTPEKTFPMKETVEKKNLKGNILSTTSQSFIVPDTETTLGNGCLICKFCNRSFKNKITICRHKNTCRKKLQNNGSVNKNQNTQSSFYKRKSMRVSTVVTNKNKYREIQMLYELPKSKNETRTRLMKLKRKAACKLCPLTFNCKGNLQRHMKFTCSGRHNICKQPTSIGMLKEDASSGSLEREESSFKSKAINTEYDPQLDKTNQSESSVLTSINPTAIISKELSHWNISPTVPEIENNLDINHNFKNQIVYKDFEGIKLPLTAENISTQKLVKKFCEEDISMILHKPEEITENMCNSSLTSLFYPKNINNDGSAPKVTAPTGKESTSLSNVNKYHQCDSSDFQKHHITTEAKLNLECSLEKHINQKDQSNGIHVEGMSTLFKSDDLSYRNNVKPSFSKNISKDFLAVTTKTFKPINRDNQKKTTMSNVRTKNPEIECLKWCNKNKKLYDLRSSDTRPVNLKEQYCTSSIQNRGINICENDKVGNMKHNFHRVDLFKPVSCQGCGRTFTQKKGLWKHKQKHCRGPVSYKLGIGNPIQDVSAVDSDKYLINFQKDKQFIREKLPSVKYKLCGKSFTSNGKLHNHQNKDCHGSVTSERIDCNPIQSKIKDDQQQTLVDFSKVHSKEKPQNIKNCRCKHCDRTFISKGGLDDHQKEHCKRPVFSKSGKPFQNEEIHDQSSNKLPTPPPSRTASNSKENYFGEVNNRREICSANKGTGNDDSTTGDYSNVDQSFSDAVWTFETLKDVFSPSDGEMSAETTFKVTPCIINNREITVETSDVSEFDGKLTTIPLDGSKEATSIILSKIKSENLYNNPLSDCTGTSFFSNSWVERCVLRTDNRVNIEENVDFNSDFYAQNTVQKMFFDTTTEVKLQILEPEGSGIAHSQMDHLNDSGSSEDSIETFGSLEIVSIHDLQDLLKQKYL